MHDDLVPLGKDHPELSKYQVIKPTTKPCRDKR